MNITKTVENGTITLCPEGWLDTASSPELGEVVDAITGATSLVLDFDLVEYMSSAGLRQVIATHKKAKSLGASFSIINVCPTVMSIFKMTNIDKKLDIKAGFNLQLSSITADRIISTIPLQTLLPMLADVPDSVRDACDALRYNSIACVSVGFRGTLPDISWMYVPENEWGMFNRLSFPSNFSHHVAPEGCAAVLAEITYNEGDDVSKMTDGELAAHTIDGLVRMGILPSAADVVHTAVDHFKFAYVVYDLDYLKNIRTVREYLEGTAGIDLVGRFSQFEYLNMDGCIRSVLDYVRNRENA